MTARISISIGVALALAACTTGEAPLGEPDGGLQTASLVLEPAEVELTSVEGAMPTASFRAYARTLDGEMVEVTPESWRLTHDRIGAVDTSGTFTANGRAGGMVEVVARAPGAIAAIEGRATIRVHIEREAPLDPSVPPSVRDRFDLPEVEDPFESVLLEYPLDGARMPNNVAPPVVQWDPLPRGGADDAYRIVLSSPYATVRAYAYDSGRGFTSSWASDRETWRILADSARGEELALRVDRVASGGTTVFRGQPVRVWLSEDGLYGTVYYWQVRPDPQSSDVFRLDAATGARASVFGTESGACVGCHSLSHDGRRLASTLDSRAATWATTIVDTASSSAPPPDLLGPFEPSYHFLAFRPDGARILASRAEGTEASGVSRLVMLDGATGLPAAASGIPEGEAGYPAWSPDAEWVAWMQGGGDGPRGTRAPTSIVVAPVEGDDALGAPRAVHEGASLSESFEGGSTDSRPTWSPDSRFLAFAHGTSSVSATEFGSEPPRAALYVVSRDGGDPIRLERGMGVEGQIDAFWPVFSPFVTEEADGTRLYWLAFYSRQDYGNAYAGTRGTGRRQLWVTAIDPTLVERGEDPSSPPYWLPGQDTRADDIAALWAPTGCRGQGESCSTSSECCSGECAAADPSMPDVLTCRPPSVCRRGGESCETAADCCSGLECNLGVCGYVPPI
ncbi:PD40 domain-containing protein [Sandaracinus amylolyticus]|uniref:PD40 domain-containing protein n=1 Tax=Sandaracinus amylolyticus TaxID=927083 RepID=UPI00069DE664|nr:PD40 domain-containing protein [Sandaracinus amylolyticus]